MIYYTKSTYYNVNTQFKEYIDEKTITLKCIILYTHFLAIKIGNWKLKSFTLTKVSPFNPNFGIWLILSRLVVIENHVFCFLNI